MPGSGNTQCGRDQSDELPPSHQRPQRSECGDSIGLNSVLGSRQGRSNKISLAVAMSDWGQKRRFGDVRITSALPTKADIQNATAFGCNPCPGASITCRCL